MFYKLSYLYWLMILDIVKIHWISNTASNLQSYRSNCNVIHFYCIIPQRITNILKPTTTQLATISCLSSLKLECEKLASEKVEIQRHYVMVREENDIKVFMYLNICYVVFLLCYTSYSKCIKLLHESLDQINYLFCCRFFSPKALTNH